MTEMARKALINKDTRRIVTIIEIEPGADYTPPDEMEMIDPPSNPDRGDIGWILNSDGTFTRPPEFDPT